MATKAVKEISEKALRKVIVLVRYFVKATKNVVLYVKNDKGICYYVTLQRNGVHTCSCPATKECYHIKAMKQAENAKIEARKAAKVAKPDEQTSPLSKWVGNKISTAELVNKTVLTTNKGFSLLR